MPHEGGQDQAYRHEPERATRALLAGLFCGIGVLALAPWTGWGPVAIFALAPVPLLGLDRLLQRAERPERIVAASLALHTTLIVVGVASVAGSTARCSRGSRSRS